MCVISQWWLLESEMVLIIELGSEMVLIIELSSKSQTYKGYDTGIKAVILLGQQSNTHIFQHVT